MCDDGCGDCGTVFEGPNYQSISQSDAGLSRRFECSTCRTDTYTSELNRIGLASGNPLEGVPSSVKDCYAAEQPVGAVPGGYRATHEGNQVRALNVYMCECECMATHARIILQASFME